MTVGEKHTISSVHTLAQENSAVIHEIRDQLMLLANEAATRRAETNDNFDRIFTALQNLLPPATDEPAEEILDPDIVDMDAIHFDSKVDPWFLNYQQGKHEMSWDSFVQALCIRFEDVATDNYVGSFNKLSQITTAEDYYDQFEHYKAYMVANNPTLPESFYTLIFISGLKDEIRTTVQMFRPKDTSRAFYLARMQQASLMSSSRPVKNPARPFFPSPISIPPNPSTSKQYFSSSSNFHKPSTSSAPPFITHPTAPTKTDPPLPSVKKRTPQQMKIRRNKGLCYNCDELYMTGHVCKTQQLFMLVAGEENLSDHSDVSPEEPMADSPSSSDTIMEISLHALTGQSVQDTIRISGHLHQQAIMVLIDMGSTHSFIDSHLADKLNVHISPTAPMLVTVANGDSTISKGMCRNLHWEMQGYNFSNDLRALPLGGWLSHYFTRSLSKPSLSLLSATSFKKFIKSKAPTLIGQFFHVHATPMQLIPSEVSTLIDSFYDVFSKPTQLPPSRPLDHRIPLKPNSTPPSQRPYKCPFIHKAVVEQLLNDLTVKDKFPIPLIEELLDELNGAVIFTKLDLLSGYHQILIYPPDIPQTAFRTHHGHYEFRVMPFGLMNAPATFHALMNEVFQPFLRKFVLVFFYDILVYSSSLADHLKHLTLVFSLLRQHSLYAKFSKCSFAQPQLEYLGHIITGNGVAADPDKVAAMVSWPQPTTLKQLRSFLGLTGYYRKFIKGYGNICKPLTELLKKDSFIWNDDATTAFSAIKSAMNQALVLALPDFTKPFTLETDACSRGVGAVLLQDNMPIAFYSKPLGPKALALSTYEKEFLAIVMAIHKWRYYLSHNQFIINTDHQSLKYLMEQKLSSALQQK
ncbi:uncharacterized protein LOC113349472 [Papaver somniferum]|uniref:uncharacterized protein LOC113349472 n=1 Tax=Papaver somniferum TaxID=3469 RepID=UPI000E6F8DA9|nr:uncharacterized protein LOC113349472 [Papaver somniferum]